MRLTRYLPNTGPFGGDDPASAGDPLTTFVRDRLGVDTADRLPTRARLLARERALDAVDRGLERYGDELGADPRDRAVEAFLYRYDLDERRLDDRTVEAIRDRQTTAIAEELFEGIAELSERSGSEVEKEGDRSLMGLLSGLDVADLSGERSADAFGGVLDRDAVETGHRLERALEELTRSFDGASGEDGTRADARSAVTATVAALAATNGGTALPLDRGVAGAVATLLGAGGEEGAVPPIERLIVELLPRLSSALRDDEGGFDPRSGMTGSKTLVALFVANLVAMGLGAWLSYRNAPPIPEEFRGPDGDVVVTAEQVRAGKRAFQANGLMNHGSILGNGSYFGVDLTADALDLKAEYMREYYARERGADSIEGLADDERAAVERRVERELDAEAPEGAVARYSAAEAYAHRRIREEYVERYYEGEPERGVPAEFVASREQAARIGDFACWTAWMAHTDRPNAAHSYTNDWPYVPGTGNRPTGQVLVWSTISVVLLVAGGGLGVWAYHAIDFAEPTTEAIEIPSPDSVSITPAQYAAAWYVPVAGALFVVQALAGALLAHYYVERTGFFGLGDALGIELVSLLPFATVRTWHINLAVLWITTLWLAGGLFLPGLFSDRDPPWQAAGTTALLGLLVAATVGAFVGVWLGTHGKFGSPEESDLWWWLGSEGLEYLEVGRLWKLLLLVGFVGWTGLVIRGVRRVEDSPTGLGHFMAYAGGSIALLFAASMLYTPDTNIAVTEFWRWWVVHMWVEGVFEFFVTAVVAVALVSMELVERGDAEKAILFEVFAIMGAGIVGVSHHYWWVGLPDFWVPLGTTFSTLEFVPLVFVLYRSLGEYRSLRAQGEAFPYTIPFLFIIASSVWNFVGGGVLGFFINLPVINYYEHGTYLTVAHAHAATFGAFGLLALGLGTYILRVVTPEEAWDPTWFRGAFWLTNVGLAIMTVASLLPVGFVQLQAAYTEGYAAARSLEFYERPRVRALLWARTLGDTPTILGALAFTVGAVKHLAAARTNRSKGTKPAVA
ncbi:nitric-oxide reductase large subunit [Halalkalicoccus sp. NIPERK01]|uniref:nitric-oxide reductase large subunit n=1 Tax=Halalkalicoccus sp. NIPERK01 TaxID=3053469 RepID=UPI00256EB969|nr:cbb3-type cytochrome c oxidase subunit I [Halalkalicoccus sp. NIPERK01]MDL5360820.1 cbb3-type cytochrome c oxidase subunit I [Halalkalicoccus sp. NIPERK01]